MHTLTHTHAHALSSSQRPIGFSDELRFLLCARLIMDFACFLLFVAVSACTLKGRLRRLIEK